MAPEKCLYSLSEPMVYHFNAEGIAVLRQFERPSAIAPVAARLGPGHEGGPDGLNFFLLKAEAQGIIQELPRAP